jgi:hypothetical protein
VRLALFLKVMSLESGPNTKIRSWRGDAMADARRGLTVTRDRGDRSSCALTLQPAAQERVFHRAFARLPLAWCTFPVEFAPRSAPVPDQHADPRPRGRARPGRAESRHDEVTMSTGHEAVKNDTDRHRKAAATHLPTCLQRRPCRRIMKHGLP